MRVRWAVRQAGALLLDVLAPLPRACFLCGACGAGVAGWVCAACRTLVRGTGPRCAACGRSLGAGPDAGEPPGQPVCRECRVAPPPFRRVVAVGPYRGLLRWAVRRFKNGGESFLAHPLAGLMAASAVDQLPAVDAWVPVPAGGRGLARRGYAQAALLAAALAETWPERRPVLHRALRRLPRAPAQTGLPRARRLANAARAYAEGSASRDVRGLRVVLVDDVLTTGATLGACARVLLRAGAREVWCVVVAEAFRAKRPQDSPR